VRRKRFNHLESPSPKPPPSQAPSEQLRPYIARVISVVCIVANRRARLANLSSRAGCGVSTRTLPLGDGSTTLGGSMPSTTWNDYVRLHTVDPSYMYVHYDFGSGHG
jgi:hypothetical protein